LYLQFLKILSGKGKSLIVLHAGNREEGLIDRCDLIFLAKAKDGDYHQEMNGPIFLNWFENQLMPALKSPSVIVLNYTDHLLLTSDHTCIKASYYRRIFCTYNQDQNRQVFSLYKLN
jgi:hypothetical protein